MVRLIYITFYILLQLLVGVKSQDATRPLFRRAHTAAHVNDRLYILGGTVVGTNNRSPKESFMHLDTSASFDTNTLKWQDISNRIVPPHEQAALARGGVDNSTLFLYGGVSLDKSITMAPLYAYETKNNTWTIPNLDGPIPVGKEGITAVSDSKGSIYLFGGSQGVRTRLQEPTIVNDMFIIDTINFLWKKGSSVNAPSPRVQYGAVRLPNNNIIYIGGFHIDAGVFPLTEVYLYDTLLDTWSKRSASGSVPSPRSSFSCVLGLDGKRVIVFGGRGPGVTNDTTVYALDLDNFIWYVPRISGRTPSSRAFYKSLVIGKYMAVTYGEGYRQETENDILLLDISNNDEYVWTTSFNPVITNNTNNTIPNPTNTTTTTTTPTTIVVGSTIGSIIALLIIIGCLLYCCCYKKKGNEKNQQVGNDQASNNNNNAKNEGRSFGKLLLTILLCIFVPCYPCYLCYSNRKKRKENQKSLGKDHQEVHTLTRV